jgi:hypothetical protein
LGDCGRETYLGVYDPFPVSLSQCIHGSRAPPSARTVANQPKNGVERKAAESHTRLIARDHDIDPRVTVRVASNFLAWTMPCNQLPSFLAGKYCVPMSNATAILTG